MPPNNDTLYSAAQVDLGKEPLVLHMPATEDRYCVRQFVNARSNNFAYMGKRATSTGKGEALTGVPVSHALTRGWGCTHSWSTKGRTARC